MKPYSESCEENKDVILKIIQPLLLEKKSLLEIGSGTGQHAIHFAQAMPHIQWHTSDRYEALAGIQMWINEYQVNGKLRNLHSPILLDVAQKHWPELIVDAIFTANTLHIMHWDEVQNLFENISELLTDDGILLIYGPFNYHGQYTSDSNARFDVWLKSRDPESGIRDFSALTVLAESNGFKLFADYEMPANNRLLCWKK